MLAIFEILLMIGMFGFVMWTFVSRTNRWNRLYDHLTNRFGKRVSKPSLIKMLAGKSPALAFKYGSTPCDVSVRYRGLLKIEKRTLRLTVAWPRESRSKKSGRTGKKSETLLISTDPQERIRFVSLKDVAVGSPDFRDRFHVKTSNSSDDTRMLNSNVQHFVFKIAAPGRSDDMTVKLHKGKLVFSMRLSESWGVKFLDGADATVIEDVVCPICTGTIADDLVSCMRCQTPHCRDCWEYNGQCATFACKSSRVNLPFKTLLQSLFNR